MEPHEELEEILNDAENLNGEKQPDLNSVEVVEAPEVEEVQPEVQATEEPKEPEQKGEEEPEAPPASEDAKFNAMLAKSQDEVRKRQVLEAQVAQMQQQLAQAPKPDPIDPFENPEGFQNSIQDAVQRQVRESVLAMSENLVKTTVGEEKYDEAVSLFVEQAQQNPILAQSMNSSANPAKFAYDEGVRLMHMQKIGNDPEAYENSLIEKGKALALAEIQATETAAKRQQQADELPRTIANVGSSAPSANQLPDDSLESLLGDNL